MVIAHLLAIKGSVSGMMPFMLAVSGIEAGKVNMQRIIEALIIAGVTAGCAGYVTFSVMQNEFKHLVYAVEKNTTQAEKNAHTLAAHIQGELEHELALKDIEISRLRGRP